MKNTLLVILFFISVIFSSCNFVRNDTVCGKYHILAVDVPDDICLAYQVDENYICIVQSKILAYYKNEQYIFVKQIPYDSKDSLDINYFIVPILKNNPTVYPEDKIIGPLKEQKFNDEISKMKLLKVKFKKID